MWILLPLLACRPVPERAAPPEQSPRTVVILSLDTFRLDAAGPGIDALRERGVWFSAAQAPAPTTLASHSSAMSGLYPHRHGVPRNEHRVPDGIGWLPAQLQGAGYRTGAFLGAMPLGAHTGFPRGFDHVDERLDRARGELYEQTERRGGAVTDAALAWLGQQQGPAVVFAHYYDAHQPYTPDTRWRMEGLPEVVGMDAVFAARRGPGPVDDGVLEQMYRADAAQADHEVGRMLQGLREMGRGDALVVLFADHGEALAHHPDERWDHGNRVYQETVAVPLVVAGPGLEPRVVDQPVSLVDLGPTVLGLVGLKAEGADGVDLGPLLRGGELVRGPVFFEATKPGEPPESGWYNGPRWKGVRDGSQTLHLDPGSGERRLFELASDPGEQRDLAGLPERASEVERLTGLLRAWTQQADPPATERVSDAEALEKLRALGYVD